MISATIITLLLYKKLIVTTVEKLLLYYSEEPTSFFSISWNLTWVSWNYSNTGLLYYLFFSKSVDNYPTMALFPVLLRWSLWCLDEHYPQTTIFLITRSQDLFQLCFHPLLHYGQYIGIPITIRNLFKIIIALHILTKRHLQIGLMFMQRIIQLFNSGLSREDIRLLLNVGF